MRLFFLELIRFFTVTVQMIKLNRLAKTYRESICRVFTTLKTLLAVPQQKFVLENLDIK